MVNKRCKLYLDETGSPDLSHHDPNYTLCGIIVSDDHAVKIKTYANQIKFKYWNDTTVVFHSVDIGKAQNKFSILKDKVIAEDFHNDLTSFINTGHYKAIVVSVDKRAAQLKGWSSADIMTAAFDKMLELYAQYLSHLGMDGQIIMESSSHDIEFHRRYAHFISNGIPSLSLNHYDVKLILTAVSFVSKKNQDIETQIADLLAYPAICKMLHDEGIKKIACNSYEERIGNILYHSKVVNLNGTKAFVRLPH
jgi:hypothetical protein